jgi:hypothetical protein
MSKIDKFVTSKLHSMIQKCILDKDDTNIRIQKLGNVFINVQEMFAQLTTYLVFLILLYYSSWKYKSILLHIKNVFLVLKPKSLLNQLEPNYIDVMCLSIIKKIKLKKSLNFYH